MQGSGITGATARSHHSRRSSRFILAPPSLLFSQLVAGRMHNVGLARSSGGCTGSNEVRASISLPILDCRQCPSCVLSLSSSGQAGQRWARWLLASQWLLPSPIPIVWFIVDRGGSGPLLGTGGLIWSRSGRQQPSPKCRWWLLVSSAPAAMKWWGSTSRDGQASRMGSVGLHMTCRTSIFSTLEIYFQRCADDPPLEIVISNDHHPEAGAPYASRMCFAHL